MEKTATLTFLGAAGTVTGSKYLLKHRGRQILLEAGLFQGLKELRLRNWKKPPFDPAQIHAAVISHAHIDHSGYLPRLMRDRFRGEIFCTRPTADLLQVLLPDAAYLQEEEAGYANRKGYSKHHPAEPLFNLEDAQAALRKVRPKPFGKTFDVSESVSVHYRRAGHILGAALVEVQIKLNKFQTHKLVFSGDLGRPGQSIVRDPEPVEEADTLMVESTYGDRIHPKNALEQLEKIIKETYARGGVLLIPAFAVGRTQELLWMLHQLEDSGRIPIQPVFVDSPMAIDASRIYEDHPDEHHLQLSNEAQKGKNPFATKNLTFCRRPEESKAINHKEGPFIIISASGMAAGGRVLHHLQFRLPDEKNTVLLAGYQAAGTRGRTLQDGAGKLKMFGEEIPVRAKIEMLNGMSAHADQAEILHWLSGFKRPPKQTFIVHGEPSSSQALADAIQKRFGWKNVRPARDGETIEFTGGSNPGQETGTNRFDYSNAPAEYN